jgi:D-sedoheptulose 7-phosphate isomerase
MIDKWIAELTESVRAIEVNGATDALPLAVRQIDRWITACDNAGGRLLFVGNGGSAAICSHLAIDFTKNGNVPALAFNDAAALTCLGNDLGYENVFGRQIDAHGRSADILFAISSSGASPNILAAAASAMAKCGRLITLTGFKPNNPLRELGDLNFYVPSDNYGFVETAHQAILHAILDIRMGWKPKEAA